MGKYLAIFSVIAVVVFGFFSLMYFAFGCRFSGKEFSPDDFSVRDFAYRFEPITGTVLSGRTFEKNDAWQLPKLVADKFVKPVYKKEKTWHLISDNGNYFRGVSADSDAHFLFEFLKLRDENDENTWTAWNSENQKLAKVLWPLIAEMARDEMYLVVGDVFSFVLNADVSKPKEFQTDLHREVAKAYLKMSEFDFENNNLESAKARISKSIKYGSTDEARVLLKRVESLIVNDDSPVLEAMPE